MSSLQRCRIEVPFIGGTLVFSGWEVAVTSRRPPFRRAGTPFPRAVGSTAIADERLEMDVRKRC
jgi:hypothetical protein